jgi:hypothetical protein
MGSVPGTLNGSSTSMLVYCERFGALRRASLCSHTSRRIHSVRDGLIAVHARMRIAHNGRCPNA